MRAWLIAIAALISCVGAACSPGALAMQAHEGIEPKVAAVMAEIEPRRGMSVSPADGALLKKLVEDTNAQHAVEIGTFRGYSGLWVASGLRKTGGRLTTYDIDPDTAKVAGKNFARAGVGDLITQVVGDAHQEIKTLPGPIDFAFIDADKEGYLDYLEKLIPRMRQGGLIVAHNVVYPPPDPRFMAAIRHHPKLTTTFANMDGAGISISKVK